MTYAPFVSEKPGRLHPVLDLDQTLDYYRSFETLLDENHANFCFENSVIRGPYSLAQWHYFREKLNAKSTSAREVDVFVWAKGSAPDPGMTRVGGDVWAPVDFDWPMMNSRDLSTGEEGAPLPAEFVGQFNFSDSKDVLGFEPPGDIMMIFHRVGGWMSPYDGDFELRWVKDGSDCKKRFTSPPSAEERGFEGWGVRCRTYDQPFLGDNPPHYPEEIGRLWTLPATKIGGFIFDPQDAWPETAGADHLCELFSVQGESSYPYTFANRKEILELNSADNGIYHDSNSMLIQDLGALWFSLFPNGQVGMNGAC